MSQPPSSGPATLDMPKTPAKYPWYRPRSRGGITSPITANAIDIRPPAPSPCTARKPINSVMFCAAPESVEPIRKVTIAAWKISRRPYRSEILPHSGVAAVEVSR